MAENSLKKRVMTLTDKTALAAKDLSFKYLEQNKKSVLDHVNVSFKAGKITVLMGSSGSGKSTLAALLAGLYPENGGLVTGGSVELFGRPITDYSLGERAQSVSMMFQNADLQFCMETLRDEMIFCLENISCPPSEMEARIQQAALKTDMTDFLDRKLTSLSGGEKQKAALTCIFLLGSKIILLDEPFANIDALWAPKLIDMLTEMNRTLGTTIIAIEHSPDEWIHVVDEIKILEKTGTVHDGITRENIENHRDLFVREGLRWPWDETDSQTNAAANKTEKRTVLKLEDLTVHVGKKKRRHFPKTVLKSANAVFREGEMTAILGPSGCGKTTLFRALLGQQPYEGKLLFANVDTAGAIGNMADTIGTDKNGTCYKELKAMRSSELLSRIGIVFQNPSNQFMTQNVLEEIETGLMRRAVKREKLKGSETEAQALKLLSEFNLDKYRNYSPYMLSQGQQRRLAVLAVLAGPQKILLLDEPTYGQDDAMTTEIMELLKKKMVENGITVIFSSHDQRLVRHWADERYTFREGRLVHDLYGED